MSSYIEKIIHKLDPASPTHIPSYLPLIAITRSNDLQVEPPDEDTRPLSASDLDRVMDYPNLSDPPESCSVMHCEPPSNIDKDDEGGLVFPRRRATMVGGYIFLSPMEQLKTTNPEIEEACIKCIPINGCTVDLPPGGRRVFREHAHTSARAGYEMAIRVKTNDEQTYTCYIVLDTLGNREIWAAAARTRCDVGRNKVTLLRPGGIAGSRLMAVDAEALYGADNRRRMIAIQSGQNMKNTQSTHLRKNMMVLADSSLTQGEGSGNADLDEALKQFVGSKFQEDKWVHRFLQRHAVGDLSSECEKLEKWMDVIKNGLKGAVLEQYGYFVEASREMTTMGREVAYLRTLVERQQETLMEMKNIDFGVCLEEDVLAENDYYLSEDEALMGEMNDEADDMSTSSSDEEEHADGKNPMRSVLRNRRGENRQKISGISSVNEKQSQYSPQDGQQTQSYIEIPVWISDSAEEITSLIKESRYTDATDLVLKAKSEVKELLSAQDSTTPVVTNTPASLNNRTSASTSLSLDETLSNNVSKKLHKKQQVILQRISLQIDSLTDRMSKRLVENLRRKNEALKASAKRERADPLSTLATLPSPVCLNDDFIALGLLVKLGRYQEAATAYAARRSLMLSECLHERPISSPIGMDAVIYAAQLSSSFFSSLAMAVEGFLDLFDSDSVKISGGEDDDTSFNSKFLGGGKHDVPPGALSAIVLWCDSELSKFANTFGSSRLLGSLALSPPGIRRKEDQTGANRANFARDREHAIDVAAKCVEQAFSFASENLDSIGLPLVQLLGKNMKSKLKGCEAEVAALLEPEWKFIAYEWSLNSNHVSTEKPLLLSPTSQSKSIAFDDRRV